MKKLLTTEDEEKKNYGRNNVGLHSFQNTCSFFSEIKSYEYTSVDLDFYD